MYGCYKQATKVSGMHHNIILYSKNSRKNTGAQSQSRKPPENRPLLAETAPRHDPGPSLQTQVVSGGNHATDLVTSQRERAHSTFHHAQEVRSGTVTRFFCGPNPISFFAII